MKLINNQTEKEYRDRQSQFGHTNRSLNLIEWLDQTYKQDLVRKSRYFKVAQEFLFGDKPLKILEIAAGVGDFIIFSEKNFPQHEYFAQELSENQLKNNIEEVAKYFKIDRIPELTFSPVENLSYADNQFDLIFIKAAVHHFENPLQGFKEIHRVLKPGGRVVFFEDPVCLDIPIYRSYIKNNFSLKEREMGINEHIYTLNEYLYFGNKFKNKSFFVDKELINEYDKQQSKRIGIKKFLGKLVRKNCFLFKNFMIWRFSPIIFVFKK